MQLTPGNLLNNPIIPLSVSAAARAGGQPAARTLPGSAATLWPHHVGGVSAAPAEQGSATCPCAGQRMRWCQRDWRAVLTTTCCYFAGRGKSQVAHQGELGRPNQYVSALTSTTQHDAGACQGTCALGDSPHVCDVIFGRPSGCASIEARCGRPKCRRSAMGHGPNVALPRRSLLGH